MEPLSLLPQACCMMRVSSIAVLWYANAGCMLGGCKLRLDRAYRQRLKHLFGTVDAEGVHDRAASHSFGHSFLYLQISSIRSIRYSCFHEACEHTTPLPHDEIGVHNHREWMYCFACKSLCERTVQRDQLFAVSTHAKLPDHFNAPVQNMHPVIISHGSVWAPLKHADAFIVHACSCMGLAQVVMSMG